MQPAAGSERRSPPGPAVPPPPRGHAPLAAAPGPLSYPAREPPQPEEERQLRISESGQFSDGLEDRGERVPPLPFPWVRRLAEEELLGPAPGSTPWERGDAEPGLPAESGGLQPHLSRLAPPGQPRLRRNPRTWLPPGPPQGSGALFLPKPGLSGADWKSLREACVCGLAPPAPPSFRSRALPGDRRTHSVGRILSSVHPPFPAPFDRFWFPGRTSLCRFSLEESLGNRLGEGETGHP